MPAQEADDGVLDCKEGNVSSVVSVERARPGQNLVPLEEQVGVSAQSPCS